MIHPYHLHLTLFILNTDTVKPVLSGHSKEVPKICFKTDNSLMHVKSIAEKYWSILQNFRPALSYQLSLRPLSIFELPL